MKPQSEFRFTGRHMAMIMVAFFGTIITVNLVMARYAVSTFGGTVVDNSYVASQKFNGWLAQAQQQKALGWSAVATLDEHRHVEIQVRREDMPLDGMTATGSANHPLGRAASIPLSFREQRPGILRSRESVPEGRWQIHLTARHNGQQSRFIETVQ